MPRLVLSSATFAVFAFLTVSTVPSIHSFGGRLSSRTTTSIPVCIIVHLDVEVVLGFADLDVEVAPPPPKGLKSAWSSSSAIVVECDDTLNIGPGKSQPNTVSYARSIPQILYCTPLFIIARIRSLPIRRSIADLV